MDKKTAIKAYKVMLEVALDKMAIATRLASSITSAEEWVAFDKACNEASLFVIDALTCVALKDLVPESDEKKLYASLRELHTIRIEAYINWEMLWREQEAIANPTGKYGVMKARRETLTAMLKDDDSGNGRHSPKQ